MICLAIETTTDISGIALADGEKVLAEHEFAHEMNLSRRLMPNIEALLAGCGFETRDLQGVGVSLGPGSFTGIRIGVTTAKTLAQALEIPIVGEVSLDLLAREFGDSLVCPLVKVHRGEVYYAFYRKERITDYAASPIDELIAKSSEFKGEIVFCGDALAIHAETLVKELGERAVVSEITHPNAAILAQIAARKIENGGGEDPLELKPFYLRRPTPEIRLDNSNP